MDSNNFFGSDDAAAKLAGKIMRPLQLVHDLITYRAGHELKGVMAYYNCHLSGLHTPMTAIIDYRGFASSLRHASVLSLIPLKPAGFRLLAVSLLPIQPTTLCYGSRDAGRTVLNNNPTLDLIMR